jgi:hypothetical protein
VFVNVHTVVSPDSTLTLSTDEPIFVPVAGAPVRSNAQLAVPSDQPVGIVDSATLYAFVPGAAEMSAVSSTPVVLSLKL